MLNFRGIRNIFFVALSSDHCWDPFCLWGVPSYHFLVVGHQHFSIPLAKKKLTSLRGKASVCARVLVGCQTWTIRVKRRTLFFFFSGRKHNFYGYPPPLAKKIATIPAQDHGCSSLIKLYFFQKKTWDVLRFFFSGSNIKIHKQDYATSMDLLDESCRSNLWSVFKLVAE